MLGSVLGVFMGALISALQALPAAMRTPLSFVAFAALAAVTLAALLATERRIKDPLIDLDLYRGAAFVRAVAAGSIARTLPRALGALHLCEPSPIFVSDSTIAATGTGT